MFDEGQPLAHPYHRTKFESEKIARRRATGPWRVYRPAIVVGHSQTGEMDKIDGPYYLFKALKMGARLPEIIPLFGPRMGDTNIVPVDFVAGALDHIAHEPGLDGKAFHLVSPEPQGSVELINIFARVAGAPRMKAALPSAALPLALKVPGVRGHLLPGPASPPRRSTTSRSPRASTRRRRPRPSPAPGSRCRRSRTTRRRCGPTGSATSRTDGPASALERRSPPE